MSHEPKKCRECGAEMNPPPPLGVYATCRGPSVHTTMVFAQAFAMTPDAVIPKEIMADVWRAWDAQIKGEWVPATTVMRDPYFDQHGPEGER